MVNLEQLRNEIDNVDEKIIQLFSKRQIISSQIGQFKKEKNLPIVDMSRQNIALKKRIAFAKNFDLPERDVTDLYNFLCKKSVELQNK